MTELAHPLLLREGAVQAGERVLDVASGPGVLAGKAAALGAAVTGVDLSPRMAELAARLHPGVSFEVAGAEELPFAGGTFEVVLCAFGIGHFSEPDRAFAEFARVLTPGGRLAVSWWDRLERSRINGIFFDALQEQNIQPPFELPPGPSAFHFSDDEALRAAFVKAGFGVPTILSHATVHALPDFEALWSLARNSFARLGTIIAALDEETRKGLHAAVAAKAAAYGSAPLAIPIAFKVASAAKGQ